MHSQKAIKAILISVAFALLSLTGVGGTAFGMSMADGLAIKGYDTVAYFKDGKALKGSASFAYEWHGMTWYFSTKDNRDLFATAPEKYAPQYDGYCAWAMTDSRPARTDPEIWKIVNGKLYLNCSKSAYEKWSRDIPGNIQKADENWKKLGGKN